LASAGQFDGQGDHHTPRPMSARPFANTSNAASLPTALPKRLRYFMQRDGAVLNMVLRIFLRVIAQTL